MSTDLYQEKLDQAGALLRGRGIDAWLLFVRETGTLTDPSLPLICDLSFTWETAVWVSADGRHAVCAGLHDCDSVRASGLFAEVVPYTEGMSAPFRALLAARDPRRIALDYSPSNPAADGLTYGMWLRLGEMLAGTPYLARCESADGFVSALRATKTPAELARLQDALGDAMAIWEATGTFLAPGRTEREIAAFMQAETARRDLTTSWEADQCPIVQVGPEAAQGHSRPGDRAVAPGQLVHIDFGVRKAGYCTDQQRMWYCRPAGATAAPPEVQRGFDTVLGAIRAAATALRPGMAGWEVDAVARAFVTASDYPEYPHALGHTVGQTTHDGGTLLGPRWERYGSTPEGRIAPGQVYTLELGVDTPAGYCGLEEEILVTDTGCTYLAPPQTALMYI